MKTNAASAEIKPPENVITLTAPDRRLGRMPAATTNGIRRQRFRILDFANESGSRAYRVQGMTRDGVYVRQNFSDLRAAECRRTQLENEYLLGDDAPARAPRMTMLTEDQLHLAEQIFRQMHKAEAEDCDLSTAVSAWLKAGRQKDAGIAPRLDDAFEQYLTWLAITPTLRPRTKSNYRDRARVFVNSMENYRLDAITPEMIDAYLDKRDVSPVSKDSDLRVLCAFFRWAIDRPRRWLTINPAAAVTVELGERPEPAVLTVPQCEVLLRSAEGHRGGRMVANIALCLFGGLRPSEANRLTWPQVNFKDKEIRLGSTDTKTGRGRVIALGSTLAAWLKAYKGSSFYLAAHRRDILDIKKAAGITTWQPDILRHTSISHYFRRSGSYGKTAEFHGNSESIIKAHYQGRVSTEDTKKFYALLPKKGGRE
jgi:site-specific recombinase XerD